MEGLSKKEFLFLQPPEEVHPVSDHRRLELALNALGYRPVMFPLHVLRGLYPLCRDAVSGVTVTLVDTGSHWTVTAVEAGDTRAAHYGLAVDYGSTTVVMQLVDMNSGTVLGEEKLVNGQVEFGTDILTRITYTMSAPENGQILQKTTVETFDRLLARLTEHTGVSAKSCSAMVISGNTCMIHFLLGLNAWTVFASPYAPVTAAPGFLWGREVGMDFSGLLYIIPAASNYVGGDIVSGLLKLDIHKKEETAMFFDIGTNGELVLGNRDWMLAGAGAAGPALEGYISRFGMRAAPGAVDSVKINGSDLQVTTIEGKPPVGICGSGIIDLLAQMRRNGWINMAGRLEPTASERIIFLEEEKEWAVVYDWEEMLYFSQTDIDQYLDTKAAAFTMIDCILGAAGITEQQLDKVYLSGAFPVHSDLESAITVGIFPDLPREKYSVLRNSSLEGAALLLRNKEKRQEAEQLAESIYCLQFASVPDFLVRMQAAKFIPHTDAKRFPSVMKE